MNHHSAPTSLFDLYSQASSTSQMKKQRVKETGAFTSGPGPGRLSGAKSSRPGFYCGSFILCDALSQKKEGAWPSLQTPPGSSLDHLHPCLSF